MLVRFARFVLLTSRKYGTGNIKINPSSAALRSVLPDTTAAKTAARASHQECDTAQRRLWGAQRHVVMAQPPCEIRGRANGLGQGL